MSLIPGLNLAIGTQEKSDGLPLRSSPQCRCGRHQSTENVQRTNVASGLTYELWGSRKIERAERASRRPSGNPDVPAGRGGRIASSEHEGAVSRVADHILMAVISCKSTDRSRAVRRARYGNKRKAAGGANERGETRRAAVPCGRGQFNPTGSVKCNPSAETPVPAVHPLMPPGPKHPVPNALNRLDEFVSASSK